MTKTKTFTFSSAHRAAAGAALLSAFCVAGCGSDTPGNSSAAGNTSAAGSSGSAAGSSSTAGSSGSIASGGSQAGSSAASGGSSAGTAGSTLEQGGSSQGGQPQSQAGMPGSSGMSTGGSSGIAGGGGNTGGTAGASGATSGGKPAVDPSSGCNKANPATGSSGSPLTVSGHQYYVKLPSNYDPSKAYPVMMMFNPTGNPISWAEQNAGFEGTGPKEAWIRIYPTMAVNGSGWGSSDVAFFEPFYTQVTGAYCIDKARVFAAGESSGGDFTSILGCEYGDKIAVAAPGATKAVNGYALDVPTKRKCKGEVTAVVIHGKNDNVVGPANGPKTRDFYAALNHCDMSKTPTPVTGYSDTLSNCVMFQGCDVDHPVYWCQHTDPNYGGTNHGWPAFAPKFLWGMLSSY